LTELVRYEAARKALAEAVAIDEVKEIYDRADVAARHYAKQARNKDLEIQAAQIRFRAERRLGELLAAQKERFGLSKGGRPKKTSSETEGVSAPEITLKDLDIDHKLSSRAQRVAALPTEKFEALLDQHSEEMRTGVGRIAMDLLKVNADQDGRQARRDLAKTLSDASAALPTGRRYPVIYADPPWHRKQGVTSRSYENHYPTMTWSEICALPVADLVLPDAWLFLWIPRAHAFALHEIEAERDRADGGGKVRVREKMPLAWAVAESWGFDAYSTAFVWTKTDEDHPDEAGGAVLVRDQDELLLMFKRGNGLPKPANGEKFGSNHRERSRPLGHSTKPQHYRRMIATMSGAGVPVLEMFARFDADNPPPPGWDLWGNQAGPQADASAAADWPTEDDWTRAGLARREERLWEHPAVANKHVVTMTRDYPDGVSFDVATCQCGWTFRCETAAHGAWYREEAVDAHRRELIAASETQQFADSEAATPPTDQPAAPAASPTPDDRIVETVAENPLGAHPAVPPAGRPGSEIHDAPIELSEFDALKMFSDFCHPRRAELLPVIAQAYAERGLAIQQSATGQWMLREAGWTRLRELEAERKALEPAPAEHPLDIPTFLRREPKKQQVNIEPQLVLDLARVDLEQPEVVDGQLQTRLPLGEDELGIQAALLAVDAGEIADREAFRLAEGRGYLHITTKSIRVTDEGRAFLAQLVAPAPAAELEARA
jgi:N6-adenosine-specific RNA methylase IME4